MAIAFVRPMMAAFVAQYPAQVGSTKNPFTEDMLTILPLDSLKCGRKYFEHKKTPPRLTASCLFHSSKLVSSAVLLTCMAALFTMACTFEYVLNVKATSSCTEEGSETSVLQAIPFPFNSSIS